MEGFWRKYIRNTSGGGILGGHGRKCKFFSSLAQSKTEKGVAQVIGNKKSVGFFKH